MALDYGAFPRSIESIELSLCQSPPLPPPAPPRQVSRDANRYIDFQAPWKLKKTDPGRMQTVLWVLVSYFDDIHGCGRLLVA